MFMAACIFFLIYSGTQKWSLVEDDYYPKELKHEEKLVKIRNVNDLKGQFKINVTKEEVTVCFPDDFRNQKITGTVHIYRPSDETLDFILQVNLDSLMTMHIPGSRFRHGKYLIKADWSGLSRNFYFEKEIFIP